MGWKLFRKQFAPEQIVLPRRNREKLPRICILSVFLFLFRDQSHMVRGTCTKVIYLHWKGPLLNERSWTVVRPTRAPPFSLLLRYRHSNRVSPALLSFEDRIVKWKKLIEVALNGERLRRGFVFMSRGWRGSADLTTLIQSSPAAWIAARNSLSRRLPNKLIVEACSHLLSAFFAPSAKYCRKHFPPFHAPLLKLPAKECIIRRQFREESTEIELPEAISTRNGKCNNETV